MEATVILTLALIVVVFVAFLSFPKKEHLEHLENCLNGTWPRILDTPADFNGKLKKGFPWFDFRQKIPDIGLPAFNVVDSEKKIDIVTELLPETKKIDDTLDQFINSVDRVLGNYGPLSYHTGDNLTALEIENNNSVISLLSSLFVSKLNRNNQGYSFLLTKTIKPDFNSGVLSLPMFIYEQKSNYTKVITVSFNINVSLVSINNVFIPSSSVEIGNIRPSVVFTTELPLEITNKYGLLTPFSTNVEYNNLVLE